MHDDSIVLHEADKEYGFMYMEALKEALAQQCANTEASDYHQYFGIQLNADKKRFNRIRWWFSKRFYAGIH